MKNKIIWVTVILVLVVIAVSVSKNETKNASFGTIKIGALLSLTGEGSAWGENAKKGIEMAVSEFRIKNKDNLIEIIYEDTHGDPKTAITGYRKLVDLDRVSIIIGPLTQAEASALSPIVATDRIPMISPAYASLANRPNPRNPLFVWMDPTVEAEQIAQYVYENGFRRVGIIGTKDNWESQVSEDFAKKFTSLGGLVIASEIVQPKINDNRLSVTKVLSKNPDAIFLGTYYQFVNSLKALSDLNYKGKLYSIEVDQYLVNETKSWSEKLQFIAPDFYTSDFVASFSERYDEKPGIPTGQAYDAANIALDLVTSTKDREEIISEMSAFGGYSGVSGKITFTPDNKTILPTAFYEVRDGVVIKLEN